MLKRELVQCYNCNGLGHISRRCPLPPQPETERRRAQETQTQFSSNTRQQNNTVRFRLFLIIFCETGRVLQSFFDRSRTTTAAAATTATTTSTAAPR